MTAALLARPALPPVNPLTDCYVFDLPFFDEPAPAPVPTPAPAEEVLLLADVMPEPVRKLAWPAHLVCIRWMLLLYAFGMLLLAYSVYPLMSITVLARIEFPLTVCAAPVFAALAFRPACLIGPKTYQ